MANQSSRLAARRGIAWLIARVVNHQVGRLQGIARFALLFVFYGRCSAILLSHSSEYEIKKSLRRIIDIGTSMRNSCCSCVRLVAELCL